MQGFNQGRYVPPEHEGITSGNTLHQRRAPGTLRRDGTQTVRFEMPFAVWCTGCQPHALIGQGVRFNAVKRRVGAYLSTPIWSFSFRHPACGGTLEIRTDPKATRYVVTAGGKARDYGDETVAPGENGEVILLPEERARSRESAFAVLEERAQAKVGEREGKRRVEELLAAGDRDWKDPWAVNRRLREGFRKERKMRAKEEEGVEEVKRRLGTDIDILPESEADGKRAALITFGVGEDDASRSAASGSALFSSTPKPRSLRSGRSATETRKDALRKQILQNTRAAVHPFG